MVTFTDLPRRWFFNSESAIYERLGFDCCPTDRPDLPGDNTMQTWRDEQVYRYFWHWELPAVTYAIGYMPRNTHAYELAIAGADAIIAAWSKRDWIIVWQYSYQLRETAWAS